MDDRMNGMMPTLTLYVCGKTSLAMRAIGNLNVLAAGGLDRKYAIEIVDVLSHPELAEEAHVLATPTLVQQSSGLVRRIIGDLGDAPRVLELLGEAPRPSTGDGAGPPLAARLGPGIARI